MEKQETETPQQAVVVADAAAKPEEGVSMKSYFRLFTYNDTRGWILTVIAVAAMIGGGVLMPLMFLVFGKFVNVFNDFTLGISTPAEFRSSVSDYALWYIYLFVAKYVLTYIWTTLISINAIRLIRAVRLDFLQATLRQEIPFFDSDASAITTRLHTNANLAHKGIAEKLGLTVQAVASFVAAFAVAFAAQWKLTLITMGIVPAIVVVIAVAATIDMAIETRVMGVWAQADRLAEDVFASIRSVHAFWAFGAMQQKYEAALDRAENMAMARRPLLYAILYSVEFFCVYSGYGLAFWQGVQMYHRGEVSDPGKIVTVIFAVLLAVQGLTTIAPQIIVVSKAGAAAHSLFKTIDRASLVDALGEDGAQPATCHGDIVFDNVHFAYPSRPGVSVLDGLSLRIPARKTTAIVGPSGSGKSTVIGLLERWFQPSGGTITLDGRPLQDVNVRWLRTHMRLVQQEPVLFNGTVLDNIAHGLAGTPHADLPDDDKRALVQAACTAAFAHDFIERMPNGYDTQIGERGAMLSGGQKQRLVIARSIVANPPILLLDEATSALDPHAEKTVQQALDNVAADRTMVVIAHRLSTIRHADNIVVMAQGGIVEQGTHHELMAAGGAYSRLVLAQDLGKTDNDSDDAGHQHASPSGVAGGPAADVPGMADGGSTLEKGLSHTASHSAAAAPAAAASFDPPMTNYSLVRCLAAIVRQQRPLWPSFGVVVLSAVVTGGTYPVFAVLFSRVMDVFTLEGSELVRRGNFYALMFFVVALGNLVAYCLLGWFSGVVAIRIARSYRGRLFRSLMRQPIAFFDSADDGHTPGALAARLSAEPEALQELLSSNVALLLSIVVNLVSSCILALAYGWKLGLVLVFGALPPLVGSGYLRIALERRLDEATTSRFAHSSGMAAEAVRGIRTVASLALERSVIARYEASQRSLARASVGSLVWTMAWYALSQSLSMLATALSFWYGGRLVSTGEYTTRQFYTVFVAVIFSGEAAAGFFNYTTSLTQAQRAANYVFSLQVPDEDSEGDAAGDAAKGGGGGGGATSVDCEDLCFAYPSRPHTAVLRSLSLAVEAGQFVALVGASGCGKTTVISLLERFYDPTAGALRMDGVPVQSLSRRAVRRHMALVAQEPVLYQGSVRENIVLGAGGDVSDEDILEACRQANIDDTILSLPDGLATACGSQGLQFSGGQRQRISLARALVRQPRLLLLDEATSSLDTASERVVQAALDKAAKSTDGGSRRRRTTVAVAHRLSTVKGADVIFVLGRGSVVEMGRHEELIAQRGVYYQMCLGQSLDQ